MKLIKSIVLLTILLFWVTPCFADQMNHQTLRKEARQAYSDGNWKDAYDLYRRLCLEIENDPRTVGADLVQAWQCLRQLNRLSELDAFREQVIRRHRNNWRLLQSAAQSYIQNAHWGYMIAGEFERGGHRGGGKYVNAIQRDRVRALQLMNQALKLTERETAKSEVAYFYLEFARFFLQYRGYHQAWRLQYLTDLSRLPDYEPGYGYEYGQRQMGAPVDTHDRPIFHQIPQSFESAKSDGERWRYLHMAAVQLDHGLEARVNYEFASFLHQQFGVQTLREYGNFFIGRRPRSEEDIQKDHSGPYEVHSLSDDETLAKLAVGVRRFSLPPGFNYIQLLDGIIQKPEGGYANYATRLLAQIYENRRQYDRAADHWQRYKRYDKTEANRHLDQILNNWGIFEPVTAQPAGLQPTVEYRFRNGTRVAFSAHRIRVERFLEDVKRYIRSNPRRLDWNKMNVNNIGWHLIDQDRRAYIGEKVADWELRV